MDIKTLGLGLHFVLELAALAGIMAWGFRPEHPGWQKILFGIGVPLLAAMAWAVFRVPDDPGQALVAIPGVLRLILELAILGGAAYGVYATGRPTLAMLFAGAILIDYAIMFERVRWLLGAS